MLECAWQWAVAESVERPDALRGAAIVATARSGGGTAPWLCWQLAAAKAKFNPVGARIDDLPTLMQQVAQKVGSMVDPDNPLNTFSRGVDSLGPEAKVTALRTLQILTAEARKASSSDVTELAVALGLPARLLRKRLMRTNLALDKAIAPEPKLATTRQHGSSHSSSKPAPGLSRQIRHTNDPQKGRFGGKASQLGFVVYARFETTPSKNWVRIHLCVEGPARDDDLVQFHLHDSFKPPLETRKFKAGRAKLSVTVWGGFTLGVWIPNFGVQLELNLAKLKDAPKIVRVR